MKIVAGLGNPGAKYLLTRHNLGFMLIDVIANGSPFQNKHRSHIYKREIEGEEVLLVKPQTFMNLSGQAVREIVNFYKVPLEDLLVIQDDKDQLFGKMKFQKSRGHGGHKGIVNIHQELQSQDYCRLKMGVAPLSLTDKRQQDLPETKNRSNLIQNMDVANNADFKPELRAPSDGPQFKPVQNTAQFVLSPFDSIEKQKLSHFLEQGLKAVYCFVKQGCERAANQFNCKLLGEINEV